MTIVRWILAVVVGFFAYWIVMLMSLGVTAMIVKSARNISQDSASALVGHSAPLAGLGFGLGSFASAFLAIAIAPAAQRRIAGVVAVVALAAWAIYGQIYAKHAMPGAVIEAGAAIIGAVLAYGLTQAMFKGRAT